MFGGVAARIATHTGDARAVWTLCRERAAVLRSLELTGELFIRGGVTIATPAEAPLIATTIQLDGDILVEVSNFLLGADRDTRDRISGQHSTAVQAELTPLTLLPDALRGARVALTGVIGVANAGVLATTWGSPAMVGPVGLFVVYMVARTPLKRCLHWIVGHAIRGRLDRITSEFRAVSATEFHKLSTLRSLR